MDTNYKSSYLLYICYHIFLYLLRVAVLAILTYLRYLYCYTKLLLYHTINQPTYINRKPGGAGDAGRGQGP